MQLLSHFQARHGAFCAVDFETADHARDTACAIAVVRVERNRVVDEWSTLIRPPGGRVNPRFTRIHGIREVDVKGAPDFAEAWTEARKRLRGARFLAAHNAGFDASVLRACLERHQLRTPATPFLCTVRLARHHWNIRPTRLPDVAAALGLPLNHHDARSDAAACAGIVTAWRRGVNSSAVTRTQET